MAKKPVEYLKGKFWRLKIEGNVATMVSLEIPRCKNQAEYKALLKKIEAERSYFDKAVEELKKGRGVTVLELWVTTQEGVDLFKKLWEGKATVKVARQEKDGGFLCQLLL